MCESVEELLAHADVLVIGNAGEQAVQALASAREAQAVVDLTRGVARARALARLAEEATAVAAGSEACLAR
jgi:hypothetical protein